jgi:hypothetical protein
LRIRHCLLQPQRGADRVDWVPESSMDAIAGHLHDRTVMTFDGGSRKYVVACQRNPHPLGLLRPQAGAALDIGEEESNDAGGLIGGHRDRAEIRPRRYCNRPACQTTGQIDVGLCSSSYAAVRTPCQELRTTCDPGRRSGRKRECAVDLDYLQGAV